jgi:hypothetical protein
MPPTGAAFDDACSLIETLVAGDTRRSIVADACNASTLREALSRLRDGMQSHAWKAGAQPVALGRAIKELDVETRREGFHVLNDWDGKAGRVNEHIIPVDVLDYVAHLRGSDAPDAVTAAVLLDYYLANLIALCALRVWDGGDADANLDRLNRMVAALQGSDGSAQLFADDAETLLLIATSHFEAVEVGYERLLARVKSLNRAHQLRIAIGHAVSMGSHLRFGYEATYGRDTIVMRDDNVADYPWLCYALLIVMREYGEATPLMPRDRIVEALANGLSSDPRAFIGQPPSALSRAEGDRAAFAALFDASRDQLIEAFEPLRPADARYSPLSFFFNFSHNVLKGTVVDALLRGRPWAVSFDDLLTASARDGLDPEAKPALATTLMGYARRNPDRIRGRLMPVIVYDPATGREAFSAAMRKLR